MSQRRKSPPVRCAAFPEAPCPLCTRLVGDAPPPPFRVGLRRTGETLLRAGSAIRQIYYVRSGSLRLAVTDASGYERASSLRGAGTFIGLEGLIGRPATLDARVETDSSLCFATPDEINRWVESSAEEATLLLRHAIAEGARLMAERLLVQGNSGARLSRFLLERETNPLLQGWQGAARHEVASLLAIRPETLSRAIRVLQSRGIIDSSLGLLDREALRHSAHESGALGDAVDEDA